VILSRAFFLPLDTHLKIVIPKPASGGIREEQRYIVALLFL
jgi:hypothetical protein